MFSGYRLTQTPINALHNLRLLLIIVRPHEVSDFFKGHFWGNGGENCCQRRLSTGSSVESMNAANSADRCANVSLADQGIICVVIARAAVKAFIERRENIF